MGGLTYLFGFFINAFIATFVAGVAALIVAGLPTAKSAPTDEPRPSKARRVAKTFAAAWLLFMTYGCVQMFRTHRDELTKLEGASVVVGLINAEDQVIAGERIAAGDAARTYVVVRTTRTDVDRFAAGKSLKAGDFDAHTASARGYTLPDWWPAKPCADGVTYNDDPFADPPTHSDIVLNWCPREARAYVQRFDY